MQLTCLLAAQPASRYSYINDHNFPIFQNLEIRPRQGKGTVETSLACASDYVKYWSQTERESWSCNFTLHHLGHPFNNLPPTKSNLHKLLTSG